MAKQARVRKGIYLAAFTNDKHWGSVQLTVNRKILADEFLKAIQAAILDSYGAEQVVITAISKLA